MIKSSPVELDERLDERSRLAAPPLHYGMLREARGMNDPVKLDERRGAISNR